MTEVVIKVDALCKSYGNKTALKDVSFSVDRGEIFGILGPNGSGKTTLLECMEGLLTPSSGSIEVLGFDTDNLPSHKIGVQIQEARTFPNIKIGELINLYTSIYGRSINTKSLVEDLLLTDKMDSYYSKLSVGQKQRVFIVLAMLHDPEILFLDEISSGLDPEARSKIGELLLGLKNRGKTIVMSSHYLEEVETLCSRVMFLKHGEVFAMDKTTALIERYGNWKSIEVTTNKAFVLDKLQITADVKIISQSDNKTRFAYRYGRFIHHLVTLIYEQGVEILDIVTKKPSLEEVFLKLVGDNDE